MKEYIKTIINALKVWVNKRIRSSTADWNQNDYNADNYVKNRTHYEDDIKTDISGISYIVSGFGLNGVDTNTCDIPLELGQEWKISNANGAGSSGPCPVQENENGELYVGEVETNNIPFYLCKNSLTLDTMFMRQFSITEVIVECVSGYTTSKDIKQLDSKYIPTVTDEDVLDILSETVNLTPITEDGKYLVEGENYLVL